MLPWVGDRLYAGLHVSFRYVRPNFFYGLARLQMLDSALLFFQEQLSNYIKIKTGGQKEEAVKFAEIQAASGLVLPGNAIALLMVNLEEERTFRSGGARSDRLANDPNASAIPTLCLNLHLMYLANFKDYIEGMKILSLVVRYFRSYRLFDCQKFPSLSPEIHQLSTELVNLTFLEQGELLRSLEIAYRPSALYRVRMLVYQDTEIDDADTGAPLSDVRVSPALL